MNVQSAVLSSRRLEHTLTAQMTVVVICIVPFEFIDFFVRAETM